MKPSENATLLDVRLEGTRSVLVDSVLVSYTTVRDKHRKGQDVLSARGVISKPLNVTVSASNLVVFILLYNTS